MSEPMWRRYARLWGTNVRADVDEEIDFHVQTRADRYIREGMTPVAARMRAEREFGDMTRAKRECRDIGEERVRQQRRAEVRGVLAGDVRYALRVLWKNPLFTVVVVATLALGIGATTLLYSAVDAVLLRPLPFADAERLVQIWEDNPSEDFGTHDIPTSPANYVDWRENSTVFEEMGAFRFATFALTGGDDAEQVTAIQLTPSLFRVLGVEPVLGRTFTEAEGQPGAAASIVISHRLWQRRFGGRGDIVGSVSMLDGEAYTIAGVMPATFDFPYAQMFPIVTRARVDIYAPLVLDRAALARGSRANAVIARLAEGATVAQAQAELETIHARLATEYPEYVEGWIVHVRTLAQQVSGEIRRELMVLFGAVVLLLLIACANVGNLMLARALTRDRELALRSALGAGRRRLVRQLLTESVMLALVGGAAGLLLAFVGVRYLVQLVPSSFPRLPDIAINARVMVFALGASVGTGLLFGALPALRAGGLDLRSALQAGGRTATGGYGARAAAKSLVAFQVAIAVLLVIGASLLIRSFAELTAVRPGFDAQRLVIGAVALPESKYPDAVRQRAAYEAILERAAAVPGVTHAALTGMMPFTESESFEGFTIEGVEPTPGQGPVARYYVVTPGYFVTAGIAVLAGRGLTRDDRTDGPQAVVINETAAAKFWPGEDPIGKRITGLDNDTTWRTIVGVVASVRYSGLDAEPQPEMYVPLSQAAWPYMMLVVRTARAMEGTVAELRRAVASVDPDLPLSRVNTIEALVAESLAQRRLNMLLLGSFGAMAMVLSAIGLYGVLGENVARRRKEIGVRLALGASPRAAMRLILSDGLVTIGAGAAAGMAGALFSTKLLSHMLYGVSPLDPVTFVLVPVFIVMIALLASYVPARRAMRLDPVTALRAE